jgi:hypothetical protein
MTCNIYQLEIVGVRSVFHMSFVTVCRVAATPLLQATFTCSFYFLLLKYFQASNIELRFKPSANAANQSIAFQIDGEPFSIPTGSNHTPIFFWRIWIISRTCRWKSSRPANIPSNYAEMVTSVIIYTHSISLFSQCNHFTHVSIEPPTSCCI